MGRQGLMQSSGNIGENIRECLGRQAACLAPSSLSGGKRASNDRCALARLKLLVLK